MATATLTSEQAAEQAAALDEARERIRDEADEPSSSQLSFELGMGRRSSPDFASLKIAGSAGVSRDLRYGEHVTVQVVDSRGEVVAEGPATCGYPAFEDHYDKHGTKTVERIHTATLD